MKSPLRWLYPVVLLAAGALMFRNLDRISDALTFGLLRMSPGARMAEAVRFFVYEVPKVLLLLLLIVFVIGIVFAFVVFVVAFVVFAVAVAFVLVFAFVFVFVGVVVVVAFALTR